MKINQIMLLVGFAVMLPSAASANFFSTTEEDFSKDQVELDADKATRKANDDAAFKKEQIRLNAKKKKQNVTEKARKKAEKAREKAREKRMKAQERRELDNY